MLVCGVDEAGRGPLIGPLVMAGVLVDEEGAAEMRRIGVKDSKLLAHPLRVKLYPQILAAAKRYKVCIIPSQEVDAAVSSPPLNLNWLEAHTCAQIINELKPGRIVVDSPSINTLAYKRYLLNLLDNKEVDAVVEHKADINYVECSAASILAKVIREEEIAKLKQYTGDFGSGYLTDPKTIAFFNEHYATYPEIFRKSWAPYKEKLESLRQRNLFEF